MKIKKETNKFIRNNILYRDKTKHCNSPPTEKERKKKREQYYMQQFTGDWNILKPTAYLGKKLWLNQMININDKY